MEVMETMEQKKESTLRKIFTRHLLVFCGAELALLFLLAAIFLVMSTAGAILPANYAEQKLNKISEQIKNGEKFTASLLPPGCSYGIYDNTGKYQSGSFEHTSQEEAWKAYLQEHNSAGSSHYYKYIELDSNIYIFRYPMYLQFENKTLNKFFPKPELLFLLIFIIGFIVIALWEARRFGRYMSERFRILQSCSEKIKEQDLDFAPEYTDVQEINKVLSSLYRMQDALKESLETQWRQETLKREQLAALAHDLKTPLTAVRGNTELLAETPLTKEQEEYCSYIKGCSKTLEDYLKKLQEMLLSEKAGIPQKEYIEADNFLSQIEIYAKAASVHKEIKIDIHPGHTHDYIHCDEDMTRRAVMNIISNAIDYTPQGETITISTHTDSTAFQIIIKDQGPGFTEKDLRYAATQFYQGDKSRSAKGHYGMGLYITETFIKIQSGTLTISNSPQTGSGIVTLTLPLPST